MAKPIKQAEHVARQDHHCYLCGHTISAGDLYLAVTFRALPADGWSGIRYAKVCRHCRGAEFCACGDCDFVIPAEPAERTHELKADPIPFSDVRSGRKTCEVRRDDRGYQVGDRLHLREYDRAWEEYTGRECIAQVTHIQRGYGLPDGLVVMSIDVLASNVVPAAGAAQGEV